MVAVGGLGVLGVVGRRWWVGGLLGGVGEVLGWVSVVEWEGRT